MGAPAKLLTLKDDVVYALAFHEWEFAGGDGKSRAGVSRGYGGGGAVYGCGASGGCAGDGVCGGAGRAAGGDEQQREGVSAGG